MRNLDENYPLHLSIFNSLRVFIQEKSPPERVCLPFKADRANQSLISQLL
jgi:hypothetical protein